MLCLSAYRYVDGANPIEFGEQHKVTSYKYHYFNAPCVELQLCRRNSLISLCLLSTADNASRLQGHNRVASRGPAALPHRHL